MAAKFTPYRRLSDDYPLLASALHTPSTIMAPPQFSGSKATLVKPFAPPPEIKHLYDEFDDKVSLLMACNLSKQPDRFLRMFVETAVVMVRVDNFITSGFSTYESDS